MMADFVHTMEDWRRMCAEMQLMDGCADCPLINNVHVGEVTCIDGLTPADVVGISKIEQIVTAWAAEHPEPQYPTWAEWLCEMGLLAKPTKIFFADLSEKTTTPVCVTTPKVYERIPADIAEKLGIEPKETKQ